jgi:hypothetical protein
MIFGISVTNSSGIDIIKQNPRQKKGFQIPGGDPSHKILKSKISMFRLGRKTQGDDLINRQIKSGSNLVKRNIVKAPVL